ncbi:site-specific DNA-methyltransferase [Treponema vincentii]|uniref:DNA methyltransferase n=1 Tax=Treponema vincentii TaxID=69710 RepID=UPI001BB01F02|nr:DNA methyltransferase [Treponema vincentii]QUY18334.1 site-specific DNA-methyltransferase [Treponema vincentii]
MKEKIAIASSSGFSVTDDDIHSILKPHQKDTVKWAIAGGCRAVFASFGLGLVIPCILAGSHEGVTILDPFFGSGTVAEAVTLLNRNWLGIELNSSYQNLYKERLALFA